MSVGNELKVIQAKVVEDQKTVEDLFTNTATVLKLIGFKEYYGIPSGYEDDPIRSHQHLRVVSKTKHSKTMTGARSTQISYTKHPNLVNKAPKSRKRSTQISKTKYPTLETCLPFKNTRQSLVKSPMLIQQESSTITTRMQFKTIQVELWGLANAFLPPWLNFKKWQLPVWDVIKVYYWLPFSPSQNTSWTFFLGFPLQN